MRRIVPAAAVTFGLLALAAAGCSGGGKTITGSVTLDGQPLADASVEFHPRDKPDLAVAGARTGPDGKFELRPPAKGAKETLPPGHYVVFVRKLAKQDGSVPDADEYGQLEAAGQLVNKVPKRYSDRDFPQITADVKADTTALPAFELKSR